MADSMASSNETWRFTPKEPPLYVTRISYEFARGREGLGLGSGEGASRRVVFMDAGRSWIVARSSRIGQVHASGPAVRSIADGTVSD